MDITKSFTPSHYPITSLDRGDNLFDAIKYAEEHDSTVINFNNGCSLHLADTNNDFWGACPYGQDSLCITKGDPKFKSKVESWLRHWDAPRDESGDLISPQSY